MADCVCALRWLVVLLAVLATSAEDDPCLKRMKKNTSPLDGRAYCESCLTIPPKIIWKPIEKPSVGKRIGQALKAWVISKIPKSLKKSSRPKCAWARIKLTSAGYSKGCCVSTDPKLRASNSCLTSLKAEHKQVEVTTDLNKAHWSFMTKKTKCVKLSSSMTPEMKAYDARMEKREQEMKRIMQENDCDAAIGINSATMADARANIGGPTTVTTGETPKLVDEIGKPKKTYDHIETITKHFAPHHAAHMVGHAAAAQTFATAHANVLFLILNAFIVAAGKKLDSEQIIRSMFLAYRDSCKMAKCIANPDISESYELVGPFTGSLIGTLSCKLCESKLRLGLLAKKVSADLKSAGSLYLQTCSKVTFPCWVKVAPSVGDGFGNLQQGLLSPGNFSFADYKSKYGDKFLKKVEKECVKKSP